MNIAILGGGIGGMTAALMASKMGFKITLIQARERVDLHSFGGGIGLWPQSQMVMERLGLLTQLQKQGLYMPDPFYMSSSGKILAQPRKGFQNRYKILSLQRNVLSKILMSACMQSGIQILNNTILEDFSLETDHIKIKLSKGKQLVAQNLIGADGINSFVRTKMHQLIGWKKVEPHHCGYAYFRAVIDLEKDPLILQKYHTVAFQSWGQGKRFGYVPLKYPKTFWFVAIPIGQEGLQKFQGSHALNSQSKQWLLKQFQDWKGKIDIKRLIEISEPEIILRTDIRKMKGVTQFPWATKDGRIILLGDSANATAPNIAQGAGLAIQSAWDMFSMIDFRNNNQGLDKYLYHRKRRAYTVQSIADTIAFIGQLRKPWSNLRDTAMYFSTKMFPSLEMRIFQAIVRYSTGGNSSQKHWLPFINTNQYFIENIRQQNCLLGSIIGKKQFQKLPLYVKKFRSSMTGSGTGIVTVRKVNLIGKILGLPSNMQNQRFQAFVDSLYEKNTNKIQKWTRVFGEGTQKAVKYETFHRAVVDYSSQSTGLRLTESLGMGPDVIRFGYETKIEGEKIHYKTKNLWFKNFIIHFPSSFLPISQWTQQIDEKFWKFKGTISLPKILGAKVMMEYQGIFQPELKVEQERKKKVVIAGGSGMIGSIVCKQFYKKGWKVEVLSRKRVKTMNELPFVTVHKWNPSQGLSKQNMNVLKYSLQDADAVINLAGHNPGEGPWTEKVKKKILDSRLHSISVLYQGLRLCSNKERIFVQSSAAGIYGDRSNESIDDTDNAGVQKSFRVECCKRIEQGVKNRMPKAIVTRFGHVFSSHDGLYPHIKLASRFGINRLGSKERFVPWVHVEDVAGSILHCIQNHEKFQGRQVNIASPQHHTYSEVLSYLCDVRKIPQYRRLGIPDFLLKTALGQMSSVLTESQRMNPRLLIQTGYQFKFKQLKRALFSRECL